MPSITPFLWYDNNLEEALALYASVFKNMTVLNKNYQGDTLFTATFEIEGQRLTGLNGGPMFRFTEAFSLFVECEDQAEVDSLWDKLTEDGEIQQCGWLKDKFGLSWQIIPKALMQLLGDPDPEKSQRVMQAMLQMKKIDVAGLERAYAGS